MEHTTLSMAAPPQPERIGPYRILHVLGEGGMGIVYEAEETEALKRRVALKVIRAGLDSREVFARFQIERHSRSKSSLCSFSPPVRYWHITAVRPSTRPRLKR